MAKIDAVPGHILSLGREGENEALQIIFDVSDWASKYGAGTVSLIAQREGDDTPYPCAVAAEENTVIWTVSSADTAKPGFGKCELQYRVGDMVVKSAVWRTYTADALGDASTTAPEAQKSWVDQVLAAGNNALTAAAHQPKIGDNGTWLTWDADTESYTDTGVKAASEPVIVDLDTYGIFPAAEEGQTGYMAMVATNDEMLDTLLNAAKAHTPTYVLVTVENKRSTVLVSGSYIETQGDLAAIICVGITVSSTAPMIFLMMAIPGDATIAGLSPITGERGATGPAGVGISNITATGGNLTVSLTDGSSYSVEVPTVNGADGYTPQRGVDYWTEADKQTIVDAVLAALPNGNEVAY